MKLPVPPILTKIVLAFGALITLTSIFAFIQVQNVPPSPPILSPQAHRITPPPPAPPKSDETANWKVYRNEKYGFEIKYPPDWFVVERNDEIKFDWQGKDEKNIYIENTANQARISYIKEGDIGSPIIIKSIEWQGFLHKDNNPGELGDSRTTLALLTSHKNKTYIIRLTPNESFKINQDFLNILSTFKFIQ